MNDELQKAIAEILNSAISAKDFIVGQLPEYLEQLLMWHAIYNFVFFLLGASLAALVCYAEVRLYRWIKSDKEKYDFFFGTVIISVGLFVVAIKMINLEWLMIIVAPKAWLAEYAAALVR